MLLESGEPLTQRNVHTGRPGGHPTARRKTMSSANNHSSKPQSGDPPLSQELPDIVDEETDIESLAKLYADDFEDGAEDGDSVSLEELSQSYANLMEKSTDSSDLVRQPDDEIEIFDPLEEELGNKPAVPISPIAIVESVLLVGRPDGAPISATEIAALMRGVTDAEVDGLIEQLNQGYEVNNCAFRIGLVSGAYKMQLADDILGIHEQFLGPAKEIRLNQAAIDCLALVAYQPGISREKLDEQRGQPSGSVLNQLVRRELLEVRREKSGPKVEPHYYPTARMLELAGLESLEDLPTVEDLT